MLRSNVFAVFLSFVFVAFGFSQEPNVPSGIQSTETSSCSFQVVDHEGKPVAGTAVGIIHRGTFRDEDRKKSKLRTDQDGKFEVKFDPDHPTFSSALIVETGNNRGVFTDIKFEPERTIQLQFPKPRTLKFRIKGDRSVLKGASFLVTNGFFARTARTYFMSLPYQLNEDGSLLTVHGVQDGYFRLWVKGKGSLYLKQRIERDEPKGEIVVDLDLLKEQQRKFRFVFEHDGKRVKPNGSVNFYVKTRESHGKKYQRAVKDGVAEVTGVYNITCFRIRIVDQGLVGYGIERIDGHSDFCENLIPVKELQHDQIQTLTVPVVPAGRIVGKVVTAEGAPYRGSLRCKARSLVGRQQTVFGLPQYMKIEDGKFEITPVPFDSKVELTIGKFGSAMFSDFVITEADPEQFRTVTMPKTESTSIKVLLPNGEPAKKCSIRVCRKSNRDNEETKRIDSDGRGVFDLAVKLMHDYRFRVTTPRGYQRILDTKILPGAEIKLTLKEGKRLSGSVANEKKLLISHMLVKAVNEKGEVVDSSITDSKGNFEFTRLPDHPVRLKASHISRKVNVELTEPIKPGLEKKVQLKAVDKRNLISA